MKYDIYFHTKYIILPSEPMCFEAFSLALTIELITEYIDGRVGRRPSKTVFLAEAVLLTY